MWFEGCWGALVSVRHVKPDRDSILPQCRTCQQRMTLCLGCHVQFLQLNRPKSIYKYKGLFCCSRCVSCTRESTWGGREWWEVWISVAQSSRGTLCRWREQLRKAVFFPLWSRKKQPRGCFNVREISIASVQLEYKCCPGRLGVSVRSHWSRASRDEYPSKCSITLDNQKNHGFCTDHNMFPKYSSVTTAGTCFVSALKEDHSLLQGKQSPLHAAPLGEIPGKNEQRKCSSSFYLHFYAQIVTS